MSALRELYSRLRGTLRRRTIDAETDEELRFHLEMLTARNVSRGMTPDEARRAALLTFGGRERTAEEVRDEARSRVLEDFGGDVRHALRTLRRSPGFTIVAVLSLALGIGANTAVFSVVQSILLRPLPYAEPHELVGIRVLDGSRSGVLSVADYVALRDDARSFEAVGVYSPEWYGITLTGGSGAPEKIAGTRATSGVFHALGVAPLIGRTPLPAEDVAGGERVVVLSHGFWRERYAESRDVLGRSLVLDGDTYTIVGVMPEGFSLPTLPDDRVWPVLQLEPPEFRAPFWLRALARLESGTSIDAARHELDRLAVAVKERYPDAEAQWEFTALDLKTMLVSSARDTVLLLYAAVGLVLLLAAANVANLLLVRATVRQPELAVRAMLGAGRRRLARQLVTESLVLAALGGALGVLFAFVGADLLVATAPEYIQRLGDARVDTGVLAAAGVITLLTGLAIGLLPALSVRPELLAAQTRGGRGQIGTGRGWVRNALVAGEIALALTVLVGAGLAVNSLVRMQRVDAGIGRTNVFVGRLDAPEARHRGAEALLAFYDDVMRRVATIPGVTNTAVSMAVPPHRLVMTNPYTPQGTVYGPGESAPVAQQLLVSPDYFATLGIRLLRGRVFTASDDDSAVDVAIVDETMANRHYGGDAVGRWIQTGDPDPASTRIQIVGVVADVKYAGLDAEPAPTIYVPYAQHPWWRRMYLVANVATGDPLRIVPDVRAAVAAVDPLVPLEEARSMDMLLSQSVAAPRYRAGLLGAFAILALVLAAAGIYGVMSYDVTQRRREIGVRLALGATAPSILVLVVRSGLRIAAIGALAGLAMSIAGARVMRSVVFDVSVTDPTTYVVTTVALLVVAVAACLVPARRASRTDPMTTIRSE